MATLFISDLHLSQERPHITQLFLRFLQGPAREVEALYILGDLFEAWLGDDMVLPDYEETIAALKQLSTITPVFVMHGNRDFLMRNRFAEMSGTSLLDDAVVIDLYGTRTLLMHGDTLCTDDVAYQEFRVMVRNPDWQQTMLAKPPAERLALARQYREISKSETQAKGEMIMDVNQGAVEQTMQQHGVLHLIHGHTHRPAVHDFTLAGKAAQRIVLADWYDHGSVLRCDGTTCQFETLT